MAAKQRLTKGRLKARQLKMHMIEKLIDIPGDSACRQRPLPGTDMFPAISCFVLGGFQFLMQFLDPLMVAVAKHQIKQVPKF